MNHLIVIDSSVLNSLDREKFSIDLPAGYTAVWLNPNQDGVEQLKDLVAGYSQLEAIHLITHGSAGSIGLGNTWLNASTLSGYASALAAVGASLAPGADLLVYGCNVAQGQMGEAFVSALATAIGADVAASDDLTGLPVWGGNTRLEFSAGEIQAPVLSLAAVEGVLGISAGNQNDNSLAGESGDDLYLAYEGNDSLIGSAGNDVLVGGSGNDSATYTGAFSTYTLSKSPSGAFQLAKPEGTDVLMGIETLKFADTTVQISLGTASAEFRVNSHTEGDQKSVKTSPLRDGGWVSTWSSIDQDGSGGGIYGQRYSEGGMPVGAEFSVNTTTLLGQLQPSVAGLLDGGWLVTWQSLTQAGVWQIYAQRYGANGQASGTEWLVSSPTASSIQPSVIGMSDGGWVISWVAINADGGKLGVYAKHYSATGSAGNQFAVAPDLTHDQWYPTVSAINGKWLVSWTSQGTEGYDVHVRQFTSVDLVDTANTDVVLQTNASSAAFAPSVSAIQGPQGSGWVVSWESAPASGGGRDIHAQSFDETGSKVGNEILIHTDTTDMSLKTSVTGLLDGGWLITWQTTSADGSGLGISGQRYSFLGSAIGSEFHVNTYGLSNQSTPNVTGLTDGGWLVSWESLNQDGSGLGIYSQRFDQSGTPLTQGANLSITGNNSAQLLNAGAGDDTLTGAGGNDTLGGGQGQDTVVYTGVQGGYTLSQTTSGMLQLVKPDGTDLLTGIETLKFDDANVQLDLTTRPQSVTMQITGDASSQVMKGGQGDDSIDGAGGNDTLLGAAGNDSMNGEAGQDAALLSGKLADYSYSSTVGGVIQLNGPDGVDSLRNIEMLKFSSGATYQVQWNNSHAEFKVNTETLGSQLDPNITVLADGGWLVSWQSTPPYPTDFSLPVVPPSIHIQRFDADGVSRGEEIQVSTDATSYQSGASVTALSNGGWVVAWSEDDGGWITQADLYAQVFSSDGVAGEKFKINSADSLDNATVALTALEDGGWLAAWASRGHASGHGVYAQRYTSEGLANGSEFMVGESTNDTSASLPAVTSLKDGGWLVVWSQEQNLSFDSEILARRYSPLGVASEAIQVNQQTNDVTRQSSAAVTTLADGGWLVTWQSNGQDNGTDGPSTGIYARRYSALGVATGDEFQVNTHLVNEQSMPDVTALADGGWLITWQSLNQDNASGSSSSDGQSMWYYGIYGQRFNANGQAIGSEFLVNTQTTDNQMSPSVTALPNGGWVVSWESTGQDGSGSGIYAQVFDADGVAAQGGLSLVNPAPTLSSISTLTGATEDTAFTISYEKLAAAANEADAYGDPLSFRVVELNSGTLSGGTLIGEVRQLSQGESLTWTPAANANGTLSAFTVSANDGLTASAAVQVKVAVAAVDDAPVITNKTLQLVEDTPYVLSLADLGYSDVDGHALDGSEPFLVSISPNSGTQKVFLEINNGGVWTQRLNGAGFIVSALADGLVRLRPGADIDSDSGSMMISFRGENSLVLASEKTLNWAITPVNDAPTISAPTSVTSNGRDAMVFSTANGNALNVGDVDPQVLRVNLKVEQGEGSLSLSLTDKEVTGDTDGSDGTLTFFSNMRDINAILSKGLVASPTVAGLSIKVSDGIIETSANVAINGVTLVPGQYIQGDASGGGGGGSFVGGGAGGAGGGGNDTLTGTAGFDVIFGDGSGGGGGGSFPWDIDGNAKDLGGRGGLGGAGADRLSGGAGNDILFGDGFDGLHAVSSGALSSAGAAGGLGGGGGGGAWLAYFVVDIGGAGGQGGLGAGNGGSLNASASLVPAFGGSAAEGTAAASVPDQSGVAGAAGAKPGTSGVGGGGGFGGAAGGAGGLAAVNEGVALPGENGNTSTHSYVDANASTYLYLSNMPVLRQLLTNYPGFGAGNDTLDGGAGSDNLFGLGGADTFAFDLSSAVSGDIDRIWDMTNQDRVEFYNGNAISGLNLATIAKTAVSVDSDGDGAVDDLRLTFQVSGKSMSIDLIDVDGILVDDTRTFLTRNIALASNKEPSMGTALELTDGTEDKAYTISWNALANASQAVDADSGPDALSFVAESITSGTLTKGGVAVTAGVTQISEGESFVWTPTANTNGTTPAFKVYASDGLGQSRSAQVNVQLAPVDDAPVATNSTLNMLEETAYVLSLADFNYSDPEGDALERLSMHVNVADKVALQYLSSNGQWETLSDGHHEFSASDLVGGRIRLQPANDVNGAIANAVLFDVFSDPDGEGAKPGQWSGAAPGTDAYVQPYSLSLGITAVNHAPIITAPSTQQANGAQTLVLSNANGNALSVADEDAPSSLSVTLSVYKGLGSISLNNSTGLKFTDANGKDGTLTFSGSIQAINTSLASGLVLSPGVAGVEMSGSDGFLSSSARVDVSGVTVTPGFYIQGDGSGGGGGGGAFGGNGGANGGAGGSGNDSLTGTAGFDVIFGDGSGGGGGGLGALSNSGSGGKGGKAGTGADSLAGGAGHDILFGDGFDGFDAFQSGGSGGLGGGGGGGAGQYTRDALGGRGGLGGGSGGGRSGASAALIADFGQTGQGETGANSVATELKVTGQAGARDFAGGGAFGGAAGAVVGWQGAAGNTNVHTYFDGNASIYNYLSNLAVLRTLLINNPGFGRGNDTLDGGAGSDNLFGLGGADTFKIDLDSAIDGDRDRVWDFSTGDRLELFQGTQISGSALNAILKSATLIDSDIDGAVDDMQLSLTQTGKSMTLDLVNVSSLSTDATGNYLVMGPTVTGASYRSGTGELLVTGTGLPSNDLTANINADAFVLKGLGGMSYRLTDTPDIISTSSTGFTLRLSATDKAAVSALLNKDGLVASDLQAFSLTSEAASMTPLVNSANLFNVNILVSGVAAVAAGILPGQFIQGDGSGAGGGGNTGFSAGGHGGRGGGGNDSLMGGTGDDIIFADGSGGGGGAGGGLGNRVSSLGGAGGSGTDVLNGNAGNDILFGDGFNGLSSSTQGGAGGIGGGGGGGGEGSVGVIKDGRGGIAGLAGGQGGSGSPLFPPLLNPLIAGMGSLNSLPDQLNQKGSGGWLPTHFAGGAGGGGFGGARGGDGGDGNFSFVAGAGQDGDLQTHTYDDANGVLYQYLSNLTVLRSVLTNYPSYGNGKDTLDGGAGSDNLFGLGGADTFKFDLATAVAGDRDRVWDLTTADLIELSNGTRLSGESLRVVANSASKVDSDADGAADDLRLTLSQDGKSMNIDLVNTARVWLDASGNYLSTNPTADKTVNAQSYSWKAHTLLENVRVEFGQASPLTDNRGALSLVPEGLTGTRPSLSAARDVSTAEAKATGDAVNLQDAIAILKMIVGLDVNGTGKALSPYQALAADFDGNGGVELNDAIGVLKHVVGLTGAGTPSPVWKFVDEASEAVSAITSVGGNPLRPGQPPAVSLNLTGDSSTVHIGLVGYLRGDVDGSYAGGGSAGSLSQSYFTDHQLSLSQFGVYAAP